MFKLAERIRRVSRNHKGFTLVELLVVVAIIGILAAVMLPRLLGYTNQARVSRAMGDIASMRSVVEAWAANEGAGYYPAPDNSAAGGVGQVLQARGIKWTGGADGVKDPWGTPYRYGTADVNGVANQAYLIQSAGPDKQFGTADDVWASSSTAPVQSGTPDVTPTTTVDSAS
ncbi:prepilin-type N-terminal cleavage/methylation domain-containing protein [Desulfovirgula thermocuniculi]|uniref:prepilin-type N-terminal cleavage/methylation domain-containing protein n=1 Tax=Desulfovirgula thermocuniculi TaxID=348842 RepID=UPI000427A490|nr:prepilin-type N-terminal cleavage/methylation domain-containing protein [Desulfovirgula thermocuniculi]